MKINKSITRPLFYLSQAFIVAEAVYFIINFKTLPMCLISWALIGSSTLAITNYLAIKVADWGEPKNLLWAIVKNSIAFPVVWVELILFWRSYKEVHPLAIITKSNIFRNERLQFDRFHRKLLAGALIRQAKTKSNDKYLMSINSYKQLPIDTWATYIPQGASALRSERWEPDLKISKLTFISFCDDKIGYFKCDCGVQLSAKLSDVCCEVITSCGCDKYHNY